MVKGSNRKMFRKPGMARRAIGILASSPELAQAANRNMPVRLQGGGDPLFEQARQRARYMLSRPNVSYGMNEDQMTQSIYQNLLSQNQPTSRIRPQNAGGNLTRQEQINQTIQSIFGSNVRGPEQFTPAGAFDTRARQAAGQDFVSRNPATSTDTQPFALDSNLEDQRSVLEMSDQELRTRQAELLSELKSLEDRPGGKRKDPLTRQSVQEELNQISDARKDIGARQTALDAISSGDDSGIRGAIEFGDVDRTEAMGDKMLADLAKRKTAGMERSEGVGETLRGIGRFFAPSPERLEKIEADRKAFREALERDSLFSEVEGMVDSDVLMEQVAGDRSRNDANLMSNLKNISMPDGDTGDIKGAIEFRDKPAPEDDFVDRNVQGTIRTQNLARELDDIGAMFRGSSPKVSAANRRKESRELAGERTEKLGEKIDSLVQRDSADSASQLESILKQVSDLQAQGRPVPRNLRRRLSRLQENNTELLEETPEANQEETVLESSTPKDDAAKDDAAAVDPKGDVEKGAENALKDSETVSLAKQILNDMNQPPELAEQKDFWHYVTLAGLGMASGRSDDPLSNIADGVLLAFNQKAKEDEKFQDNKYKRYIDETNIKYKQIETLFKAEELDLASKLNEAKAFEATSKGQYYQAAGVNANAPDAAQQLSKAKQEQLGLTPSQANFIAYDPNPPMAEEKLKQIMLAKEVETGVEDGEIFMPFTDGKAFVFKKGSFRPAKPKEIKAFYEKNKTPTGEQHGR